MKVNDIVEVRDGSYSVSLVKGVMRNGCGSLLRNRHFRVLALSGKYPTNRVNDVCGTNDIMLVDIKYSDFILFSQEHFCCCVIPAVESSPVEVTIPHGTKHIHLTLQ